MKVNKHLQLTVAGDAFHKLGAHLNLAFHSGLLVHVEVGGNEAEKHVKDEEGDTAEGETHYATSAEGGVETAGPARGA